MRNLTPDERFMRRAIALSRRGFPAPNPHVGCVIVRDGEIVGEGYHHHAGGPHAEVVALSRAGELARGADAYVTLEPCNHHGRTPPCTEALLRAGISRVVVATSDPNPRAAGGLERLRERGVDVADGVLPVEAAAANERFLTAMRLGRPHVTIKAAASLDGRIALPSGESQWITGPAARRVGHRLRAECAAVLVGRRTVEMDNPLLTARIPGVVNQPLRIVLDPRNLLTGKERVFDNSAPTLHVTGPIDLQQLLEDLFRDRITSLLVEGGGTTIAHFMRSRLADQLELFLAPKLLGDGPSWVSGLELRNLTGAPEVQMDHITRVGQDLRLSAHLRFQS